MCLKPTAHSSLIFKHQRLSLVDAVGYLPISHSHLLFCCQSSEFVLMFTFPHSHGSGPPSPSPAQRRWNRLRQSFRFQFPFLMISLSKSCDISWPMRGWGSITGSSWKDFPCFYKWVFKEGGHSYPGLGYCL